MSKDTGSAVAAIIGVAIIATGLALSVGLGWCLVFFGAFLYLSASAAANS